VLVKVHTCYSIELSEPRPVICKCRELISAQDAEDRIKKGMARWAVGYDRPKPYEDGSQICMTGRTKKTPRGATIEKAHMERAYIDGDKEEQLRIETYGLLTLLARISVGKVIKGFGTEPQDGRETDWGRSWLVDFTDQRTVGGYAIGSRITTGMRLLKR
jgi:hypothetical protein